MNRGKKRSSLEKWMFRKKEKKTAALAKTANKFATIQHENPDYSTPPPDYSDTDSLLEDSRSVGSSYTDCSSKIVYENHDKPYEGKMHESIQGRYNIPSVDYSDDDDVRTLDTKHFRASVDGQNSRLEPRPRISISSEESSCYSPINTIKKKHKKKKNSRVRFSQIHEEFTFSKYSSCSDSEEPLPTQFQPESEDEAEFKDCNSSSPDSGDVSPVNYSSMPALFTGLRYEKNEDSSTNVISGSSAENNDFEKLRPANFSSMPSLFTGFREKENESVNVNTIGRNSSSSPSVNVELENNEQNEELPTLPSSRSVPSLNPYIASWISASVQEANAFKQKSMKTKRPDIFEELQRYVATLYAPCMRQE